MKRQVMQAGTDALRLTLPELRHLELYWSDTTLLMDDDSFQGCGKLRVLCIAQHIQQQPRPCTLTMTPRCLAPLTAMKTLIYMNCALDGVPPAVACLGASLTSLTLVTNRSLQLGEADKSVLLQLHRLRKLDVRKSITSSDPDKAAGAWNESSIQILIDLPGLLMARHGVTLDVAFASSQVSVYFTQW